MPLSELQNISKVIESKLNFIGIYSIDQLKKEGSKAVFEKLLIVDSSSCINMLYALEGAIQNIRWHNLDKEIKQELKDYFNSISFSSNKINNNC